MKTLDKSKAIIVNIRNFVATRYILSSVTTTRFSSDVSSNLDNTKRVVTKLSTYIGNSTPLTKFNH